MGFTAFDFYDLENVRYWYPLPTFPFPIQIIATDEAAIKLAKLKGQDDKIM